MLQISNTTHIVSIAFDASDILSESEVSNSIEIENLTAAWTKEHNTLSEINFSVKKGKLYAIIGAVGVGKVVYIYKLIFFIEFKINMFFFNILELLASIASKRNSYFKWYSKNKWKYVLCQPRSLAIYRHC